MERLRMMERLPQIVAALSSHDAAIVLEAATQLRNLLNQDVKPPIDQVIAAGVVPRLVQFLAHNELPSLQYEAAWALTNIAAGSSAQARVVVEMGAVPFLVQLVASPTENLREQATWALGNLAGDSPQLRDYILQQGAMRPLLQAAVESAKLSLLRNVAWTISNLCRGKPAPPYDLVSPAIPVLARLLYSTDEQVLADACWALSFLSDGPNDRIQAILDANACPRLLELLQSAVYSIQTPALRVVGNLVTGDDLQTQVVLHHSGLSALLPLLASPKKSIRKEACWALSNITAGNSSHIQAVIEARIFPQLVALLHQADFEVKVQAAWAIANATSSARPEHIRYLAQEAGCIGSLCALLTGDDGDSDKVVPVVLEALDNFLRAGARDACESSGRNEYAVYIQELGVLDRVVQLQTHSDDDIRDKAVRLLRVYNNSNTDDIDMESETSPAWNRAGGAGSNAFSFSTFHAALP